MTDSGYSPADLEYHSKLTAYSAMTDWFEERPLNEAMREKIAQCIRARLDIIGLSWSSSGAGVKMLDYACGNGFLSRVSILLKVFKKWLLKVVRYSPRMYPR